MTIAFLGHVEEQRHDSTGHVQLVIHGATPVCRNKIVVLCPRADAAMYIPGTTVRIQIHPA